MPAKDQRFLSSANWGVSLLLPPWCSVREIGPPDGEGMKWWNSTDLVQFHILCFTRNLDNVTCHLCVVLNSPSLSCTPSHFILNVTLRSGQSRIYFFHPSGEKSKAQSSSKVTESASSQSGTRAQEQCRIPFWMLQPLCHYCFLVWWWRTWWHRPYFHVLSPQGQLE